MMFRLVARLKKKHGIVLFAVVAFMALLIAMASAAYYTARGSYNAVVSNYNYSQLYLSAVSVADMVAEAVINTNNETASAPSPSKEDSTHLINKNDYSHLRNAIIGMNDGDEITARSTNLDGVDISDPNAVINALNTATPTEAGMLDGVTLSIKCSVKELTAKAVTSETDPKANLQIATNGKSWDTIKYFLHSYTITTTAYYRGSTIQIEDIISIEFEQKDHHERITSTPPSGGYPSFNTFFTSTGQTLGGDGKYGLSDNRVVKVDSDEISDDAYFEGKRVYVGVPGSEEDMFSGSISASNSLYLTGQAQVNPNIGPNNNWVIGEDLVITGNAKVNLKGNGNYDNDLIVGGDLVINNSQEVSAGDIYVEGDLILMGQPTFNGNLHVKGNIYYAAAEVVDAKDELGNPVFNSDGSIKKELKYRTEAFNYRELDNVTDKIPAITYETRIEKDWSDWQHPVDVEKNYVSPSGYPSNDIRINGTFSLGADSRVITDNSNEAKFNVNNSQVIVHNGGGAEHDKIGTYDSTTTQINYVVPSADDANDVYVDKAGTGTASQVIAAVAGDRDYDNNPYKNYTSPQSAYNNIARIEFDNIEYEDILSADGKTVLGQKGIVPILDKSGNPVKDENQKECNVTIYKPSGDDSAVTVTLPYVKEGYTLDMPADHYEGEGSILNGGTTSELKTQLNFDIQTQRVNEDGTFAAKTDNDTAMPIVLAGNVTDPSSLSSNAQQAFNWSGNTNAQGNAGTFVSVVGEGNVVFEMANYDKTSGTYKPYDAGEKDKTGVVEYIQTSKTLVGSQKQLELLTGETRTQVALEEWKDVPVLDENGNQKIDPVTKQPMTQKELAGTTYVDEITRTNTDTEYFPSGEDKNTFDQMYDKSNNSQYRRPYQNKVMLVSNACDQVGYRINTLSASMLGYVYAPNATLKSDLEMGNRAPIVGGLIVSTYEVKQGEYQYSMPPVSMVKDTLGALNEANNSKNPNPNPPTVTNKDTPGTPTAMDNTWLMVGSNYLG